MPRCPDHRYAEQHAIARQTACSEPNSSIPMIVQASGVLLAPAKTATKPSAAARSVGVPGFVAEITLSAIGLPPGVTAPPVKIAANTNEAKITLTIAPTAKVGPLSVIIQGTAKHSDRDWLVKAAGAPLTIQPVPKKK